MKFLMKNSLDIFRKVERSFRVIDYVKVLFLLEGKKIMKYSVDLFLEGSFQLRIFSFFM